MLRLRAAVESYAGTSGDLDKDRQESLESGRSGDLDLVDQSGDEVVGVFEGGTDGMQSLHKFACALVVVMGDAVEFAGDGFAIWCVANQLVVHRK